MEEDTLVVNIVKDTNEYAMAMVRYAENFYVIPWELIKEKCKAEKFSVENITYCVNKSRITFTLILKDTSFVIVFNADDGVYEYVFEGSGIVKAVCCDNKVIAAAEVADEFGIVSIYRCESTVGSFSWLYKDTGIKKKNPRSIEDFEFAIARNDAFLKIFNPVNEIDYIRYVEENYSIYGLYDYWKDKDIDAYEGSINANSIFIEFASGEPLTTNKITFCNNPKFAAGYLKYIVLGDAAYMILLADAESDEFLSKNEQELENDYIPNIDYILNDIIRSNSDKFSIVALFEEMVELCDMVFGEKDKKSEYEMLCKACDMCNMYFSEKIYPKTGYRYKVNVHYGSNS